MNMRRDAQYELILSLLVEDFFCEGQYSHVTFP